MFIKQIYIDNFRIFDAESSFVVDELNIPDGTTNGSGLNVFVGENGSGKTALLDAISLPLLEYKADNVSISDLDDPDKECVITLFSENDFSVAKAISGKFQAKGFQFKAKLRTRTIKSYLSKIITSDRLFIQADDEKIKPESPDLRISVNSPWKANRFTENDIIYLDRNRIFQIRSGTYNSTRFDRLMEDFNYQYIKNSQIEDLNDDLNSKTKKGKIENKFLSKAIDHFKEISGLNLKLDFLDNHEPFRSAFFAIRKDNHQQIQLNNIGSGYEMIFSLLYSFHLSEQSGKELIILIDEPELHLHPVLQEKFVDVLIEFSKSSQIFLASHSPLLVKQLSFNEKVKINVLENGTKVSEIEKRVLPFISANETNFIAFNLATEEYHNELFEELKYINGDDKSIKDFDNDFFINTKGEDKNSPWKANPNEVSKHTYIRNQIHHQRENGKTEYGALKNSIEKMRSFF